MEPEDLPELPELPDLDDLRPEPGPEPSEPEPIVPPVDPDPAPGDGLDLGGIDGLDLDQLGEWQPPEPQSPEPAPQGPQPIDGPAPDEVHLDLEDPMSGGAPIEPGRGDIGALPDEIDLSLDPEDDASLTAEPPTDETAGDPGEQLSQDPGVQLPLDGADEALVVDPGNAWLAPGLVAAGALAIGLALPVLLTRRRSAPIDFAAQLDELGIDARVEHLDLTGLQDLLDEGRSVLLSTDGSAGVDATAVLQIRSLDRDAGELRVADQRNATYAVDLDRFEVIWSDSANQVVMATSDGGHVALVPVVLGDDDLEPSR